MGPGGRKRSGKLDQGKPVRVSVSNVISLGLFVPSIVDLASVSSPEPFMG